MVSVKCYLQINILLTSILICLSTEETKQKEIEILEREKKDLLKQIHTAIDESVSLLQKDNNTQSIRGINYMLELKQQMEKINETDSDNMQGMEENSNSELENRRKMRNSKDINVVRQLHYNFATTLGDAFDINKVLVGKKMSAETIKQMMESRVAMQKKLDEWILQRELEKSRIRERYLANQRLVQSGLFEKCPRFGTYNKKKRYRRRYHHGGFCNSSESDIFGKEKRRQKPRKGKRLKTYPCCRKCCKKSYLGCL